MIYPNDFEGRLGFDRIREQVASLLTTAGADALLEEVHLVDDITVVRKLIGQTYEMRTILISESDFQASGYKDIIGFLNRVRVEGTFLEATEMLDLQVALEMIGSTTRFFNSRTVDDKAVYPLLTELGAHLSDFRDFVNQVQRIVDRFGRVKDSASVTLTTIRRSIAERSAQISKRLHQILRQAQTDGYADADSQVVVRDGRAVLPIMAGNKRKIKGLVHSESATGRTAYIEPLEVVELNNEVSELEAQQRREVIRILIAFADMLRPHIDELLEAGGYLCSIEFIAAKARYALSTDSVMPKVVDELVLELHSARHPLLEQALRGQARKIVPLDIRLTTQKRILLISGPNAGGKSVCLKTVGLLQYMLQCGFLVPAAEDSVMGVFSSIFIDIGDQQNIDNDLSTYSSHLMNMRKILERADDHSMVLIDEFGGGTEPTTGGAIAESILEIIAGSGVYGVITTHYANLKYFASTSDVIENGAMLFDVQQIKPLFKLEMGHAGSSFAFEIARKIGLPEKVLTMASLKIGGEQIDLERQLRQAARDKRYWQNKREKIRDTERGVEKTAAMYEAQLSEIQSERAEIIRTAKAEAQSLLAQANRVVETTIREIKESAAEREATRRVRAELDVFRNSLTDTNNTNVNTNSDDIIDRKMRQLQQRQQTRQTQQSNISDSDSTGSQTPSQLGIHEKQRTMEREIEVGSKVRMQGQQTIGEVLSISGNKIAVAFGALMSTVDRAKLDIVSNAEYRKQIKGQYSVAGRSETSQAAYDTARKRIDFSQRLDVRGMRAAEALAAVEVFVDEAIMLNFDEISILHGKGTGALKQQIRQYLESQPIVGSIADEKEEFGGAGITIVRLMV